MADLLVNTARLLGAGRPGSHAGWGGCEAAKGRERLH